jgi:hypothetical protein
LLDETLGSFVSLYFSGWGGFYQLQPVDLADVEDAEHSQHSPLPLLLSLLVLEEKWLRKNNVGALLAFTYLAACRCGLLICEPSVLFISLLCCGKPEDRDVDTGVCPFGDCVGRDQSGVGAFPTF